MNRLPIETFVDEGYLQEVNRLLLHPLGLALEVSKVASEADEIKRVQLGLEQLVEDGASAKEMAEALIDDLRPMVLHLSGIWDCRDDLEGIYFSDGVMSATKAIRIEGMLERALERRRQSLGYDIQPIVPTG